MKEICMNGMKSMKINNELIVLNNELVDTACLSIK